MVAVELLEVYGDRLGAADIALHVEEMFHEYRDVGARRQRGGRA